MRPAKALCSEFYRDSGADGLYIVVFVTFQKVNINPQICFNGPECQINNAD